MSLVRDAVRHLERRGIEAAIIGGIALAAHGIARATLDADLLVTDPEVLREGFWGTGLPGVTADIHCGDAEDPLAGVVRLERGSEAVDVVVGRSPWQHAALRRRLTLIVDGEQLPVVARGDLVLLKLFAGGPQDEIDVRLLYGADPAGVTAEIEPLLSEAPVALRSAWDTVRRRAPG